MKARIRGEAPVLSTVCYDRMRANARRGGRVHASMHFAPRSSTLCEWFPMFPAEFVGEDLLMPLHDSRAGEGSKLTWVLRREDGGSLG